MNLYPAVLWLGMKIGDEWKFPEPASSEFSAANPAAPDALHLTPEAGEVLSAILEQFASEGNSPAGALLLSGELGVDRSHFLSYVKQLLADPDYPFWGSLLERLGLGEAMRPGKAIHSLFIRIPQDRSENLGGFLLKTLGGEARVQLTPYRQSEKEPEEFSAQIMAISAGLAQKSVGMIVLESISDRIDQLNNAEKHQKELQLYRILSKSLSKNGILTVLIGRGEHLIPEFQPESMDSNEEAARNYSWIGFDESPESAARVPVGQEEEFRERFQLLIYDWIQTEVPSWKPERSPNYRHVSQALTARMPDGEKNPEGVVYLKSVYDPCWSDEDISRLQNTPPSWILMVLSPFERFYEFESRLKEMVSRLPMLMIWRPDAPAKAELEVLHSLTLEIPSQSAEGDIRSEQILKKIRPIFTSLYVSRGQLIDSARQHSIHSEISGRSIRQYLSDCLKTLQPQVAEAAVKPATQTGNPGEHRARHWAALLTGNGNARDGGVEFAQKQLMEWLAQSTEIVSKSIASLPEAFQTTGFWTEVKAIESPLRVLKTVLYSLRSGTFSFSEAMEHAGRSFGWDEERLLKWKQGLENLAGLARWLPAFQHAYEYLGAAFTLGRESLDGMRESLLQSIHEPHRFLDSKVRNDFDERFLDFKKSYMDSYFLLHEDALHVMSGLKKDELKIDPVALRNLDLLSGLQYTDKSYLNRVKLLAKWIQHNQCNLPLHQILELYPRCYCNFNPCNQQQPAGAAAQINSIIQEGLEYFRGILRRCGPLILREVRNQPVDENNLRQITAAIEDGPMIPLKAQSIQILNRIIVRNSSEFLAEIRRAAIKTAG